MDWVINPQEEIFMPLKIPYKRLNQQQNEKLIDTIDNVASVTKGKNRGRSEDKEVFIYFLY